MNSFRLCANYTLNEARYSGIEIVTLASRIKKYVSFLYVAYPTQTVFSYNCEVLRKTQYCVNVD